jgi:hypothetical protein
VVLARIAVSPPSHIHHRRSGGEQSDENNP